MSSDENGLGPSGPADPESIEAPDSAPGSQPETGAKAARRQKSADAGRTAGSAGATPVGRAFGARAGDVARVPGDGARPGRASHPDERLEAVLARIGAGFYDDPEIVTQVAMRILALERYRLFED